MEEPTDEMLEAIMLECKKLHAKPQQRQKLSLTGVLRKLSVKSKNTDSNLMECNRKPVLCVVAGPNGSGKTFSII